MPAEMNWYIEGRVFYGRLWGKLTLDDVDDTSDRSLAFLKAGTPLVHSIIDDSGVEEVPKNLGAMKKAFKWAQHPNCGWTINVGDAALLAKFMMSTLAMTYGIRYRRMKTLNEAIEFLKQQDQTLNWDMANVAVVSK